MATAVPPQLPGLSAWRPLARGGFATVWEARQETLNRLVAVKVDQRVLDTDTERRRFLREAGAAGRMSGHPGIVTVHDAGLLADGRPFLVMELCPGGSLNAWVTAPTRPPASRVRDVGVRIADALAAAHSRGVLHRDVKPPNILIDAYDHAGLADFGLAHLPEPGIELAETLDAITPAYAPPEVFQQAPPTEFADVYSLAATLYALLSGYPPRGAVDGIEAALAQLGEPIEPIPNVDPRLMGVLLGAMSLEPTSRPTAAQFRDQLAALPLDPPRPPGSTDPADRSAEPVASAAGNPAAADGEPAAARESAAGSSAAPASAAASGRRRRRLLLPIIAALVVLVVLLVVLAVNLSGAPAAGPPPASGSATTSAPATPDSTSPGAPTAPGSGSAGARPLAVPAGFVDCSRQLGPGAFCAGKPECWGGLTSLADSPNIGTPARCRETHVYQTFAAGGLDQPVLRQSALDKNPRVRALCTEDVLDSMLTKAASRRDWEIYVLPPQDPDDQIFRCIFGRAERERPLKLSPPA